MKKATWMVRVLGWSGEASATTENGITTYSPGTTFGWKDLKAFDSAAEADDWLCDRCRKNGYPITDYTIVRR